MKYQALPSLKEKNYLPEIFGVKHLLTRALLHKVQEDVLKRCEHYLQELPLMRVPKIQKWNDETHVALRGCYEGPTVPLNNLKDEILQSLKAHSEINLQRCAYCMLNDPRTWDHYLPKSVYPEFAAYHANLLYVCFSCNHVKHDNYHKNDLIYSHPYFTVLENVPMLHCQVSVVNDSLAINYYCAGVGEYEMAGRIAQSHISNLKLDARFKIEASSLVSGFIGELRTYFPNGVSTSSLENLLRAKYAEAQELLGVNAWDARLWHGLNKCAGFLNYVNQRIRLDPAPSDAGFDDASPPLIK